MVIDISKWNIVSLTIFMIIYHVILVLLLWSIVMTMSTDPGKVPVQWVRILYNLGIYNECNIKKILFNMPFIQTGTYTSL
jgi:hypothetical protein